MSDRHADGHLFPGEPEPRQRVPAGQAMAAIAVALLLGSLLNADRLERTAQTQPFGWQRTWALRITGPLQDLSEATGLNRPRALVVDLADNAETPLPDLDRPVVTAPPLPAPPDGSGSTTTTTTEPPPPVRIPTAADPLRVHIAGDSLVIPLGGALLDALPDAPIQLTEGFRAATGLARPDVLNWPAKLTDDLAELDPDVVVLGFGGNDAQGIAGPDGPLELASPEWAAEYQRRVAQVLDAVEREGRTVYWMGLPTTTASNIERAAPLMRRAVESELAIRPWAHYIDTSAVLAPDGYTAYLPDGRGGSVKVRDDDGVHLTTAGADRVVVPLADRLADERDLPR